MPKDSLTHRFAAAFAQGAEVTGWRCRPLSMPIDGRQNAAGDADASQTNG
jgi:hypothetical protein